VLKIASRMGVVFLALLVLDTLALTVLAAVRPDPWGMTPILFSLALGFIGLVVFVWVPRRLPTAERQAEMPTTTHVFFRMSLAVIAICQLAAVAIGIGCLVGIVYFIIAG
jgi:hypothetical protein